LSFGPSAFTLGCGFLIGILIKYAVKKVIKIAAVIVGLFLARLAYIQYHQIANINWNKLQQISEGALITLANVTTQIPGISGSSVAGGYAAATASSLAMTSFGIPLMSSISAGLLVDLSKDNKRKYKRNNAFLC
jgi:uncharacterized membrane protein (Fun14 family)